MTALRLLPLLLVLGACGEHLILEVAPPGPEMSVYNADWFEKGTGEVPELVMSGGAILKIRVVRDCVASTLTLRDHYVVEETLDRYPVRGCNGEAAR